MQEVPLPKPITKEFTEQLKRPVYLEKAIEDEATFQEAAQYFQDRFDLKIKTDVRRFKSAAGVENVEKQTIRLPALEWVRLQDLLQVFAKQVDGVCFLAGDQVLIVPDKESVRQELLAQGCVPLPTLPPDIVHQGKVFTLLTETYHRNRRHLRSGTGTGTYEQFMEVKGRPKPEVQVQGKFTLHFDHKRYYVCLRDAGGSRIIISDDSAVFIAHFPLKQSAWAKVFGPGQHDIYEKFPWPPCDIARGLVDPERWSWEQPLDEIRVEKLPEPGYTLHIRHDKLRVSWTILRKFGWNISCWESTFDNGWKSETKMTWKKSGDFWHVMSIELTVGPHQPRRSLRFDDFTPNVVISPDLFHLTALELPAGTSIKYTRDYRHPAEYYTYRPIGDHAKRPFLDMEDELESLPER